MHIPDGLLPPSIAISGYAVTGGLTWFSLRQIKRNPDYQQEIPKASLLTAVFFVSSLIHIPIPPFSIHLILNGLMGIILDYFAFPAVLTGLFFQAVFFQHGGLSTLGVNAVIMGLPVFIASYLSFLSQTKLFKHLWTKNVLFFLIGALTLFFSASIFVLITVTNISPDLNVKMEQTAIFSSLIPYGFQAIIEGIITVMVISFLLRVKPEILPPSKI
ncbi:MAG: cobalt transporter CbiM [Cyanobacterium sp. T60_A2020_053]|nr:cobalt transporter CbiM [Cyanobacterium sp. T60_A2020_053]